LTADGGTAPYSNFIVSAGALPPGLALSSDGAISGKPTATGSFSFTVRAQDSTSGPAAPYTGSQVYSLSVSFPVVALPLIDTFTRANDPLLGTSWTVLTGSIPVQSSAGHITTSTALAIVHGATRADVTLQIDATLPTVNSQVGLVARQSGPGDTNEYFARLIRTGNTAFHAQIFVLTNGAPMPLAETDVSSFIGVGFRTTIQFVVAGNSLKLFVGTGANNLAAFATDSTIALGAIGVRGSVGTTIDNFMASDVPVAAPSLPDDFSTSSNSNQLDANWEDRAGNFSVVSGMAKGSPLTAGTAANVSILRGADYANVVVSADINVPSGQRAGLVARYQGSGDNTMYLGEIDNRSGTPIPRIMLSTGPGNWVVLNTGTTSPGTMAPLRFVVNGDSLQLFIGNTLLTFATDTTLTQGSIGMRGIGGTTFDNFNAKAAPTAQASLPFQDLFDVTQAAWQVRQDDFQVSGGLVAGQDPQTSDDVLVEQLPRFAEGHIEEGVGGWHGLNSSFANAPTGDGSPRPQGQMVRDAIEPAADRVQSADRGRFPGQNQKGGLESVLSILHLAQHAAADIQDHARVAPHQFGECGLIVALQVAGHKIAVL
jgi:hypothetical protein